MILNDLRDLENKVQDMRFERGLCLALVLLCTEFGEDMLNISSHIEWKSSYMCKITFVTLNKVKVTRFELDLHLAPNLVVIHHNFFQIFSGNHLA